MNETAVKEFYLRQYKRLCRAETYAKVELQNYLTDRNLYGKPDMSGMPHGGDKSDLFDKERDRYESRLIVARHKREEFREDLKEKIAELLEDDERTVLNLRYIQFVDIKAIANFMNYTERSIHRLKKKAVRSIKLSEAELEKWNQEKVEREGYE